eukprot:1145979-Pelagomonas_calceolata.AAC.1
MDIVGCVLCVVPGVPVQNLETKLVHPPECISKKTHHCCVLCVLPGVPVQDLEAKLVDASRQAAEASSLQDELQSLKVRRLPSMSCWMLVERLEAACRW